MSVLIVCCRSWISCPENKADTTYHLVVVGGGGAHASLHPHRLAAFPG